MMAPFTAANISPLSHPLLGPIPTHVQDDAVVDLLFIALTLARHSLARLSTSNLEARESTVKCTAKGYSLRIRRQTAMRDPC